MPRPAKCWYRKQDNWWYTTINGKQVKLAQGKDARDRAQKEFHRLLGQGIRRGEMDGQKVAVLCETYLEHCQHENAEETYAYKVNILSQFCDALGARRCDQVIPNHVTHWLKSQKHWGDTMRAHAIGTIKAAFNWAVKEGLLSHNPIKSLPKPQKKARIVTIEEKTFERILRNTDDCFRDYLTALWGSGARPGEVASLTAENYDAKRKCWVLEHHKTEGHTGTKTIWLTDELVALTERLIKQHPTGLLFRNTRGGRWTRTLVWARLQRIKEELNIKGPLMAYATRHSFATNAIARGVDSVVLAKMLGHKSTDMIMKHYVHPQDDHMRACVEQAVNGGSRRKPR